MKLEIYYNKKTEKHNKTKNSQICGPEQNATDQPMDQRTNQKKH